MKLLHAADIHLGLTRFGHSTAAGGNSRIDDFAATLDLIVATAISERVAAVLFAGDTNNSRREGPQERDVLARAVRRLLDASIRVVFLPGNHDGMSTIGDITSHALRYLDSLNLPGVYVLLKPGLHVIPTLTGAKDGPLHVVAIPYPHKRAFNAILPGREQDARILEAGARMDQMIEQFAPKPDHTIPAILLGHFTTVAAKLGSEQSMKSTWDVSIDPRVFEPYDYVALGHIHRQQQVAPNAWYAGSPEFIDFGEEDQAKGFLLVDVKAGRLPVVTPIGSSPRHLHTIHFSGDDVDAIAEVTPGSVSPGDIIKLKFDTPTRPRADTMARLRASALRMGASAVVPDWKPPKNTISRARVQMTDDMDRSAWLAAWLEASGITNEAAMAAGRELIARIAA